MRLDAVERNQTTLAQGKSPSLCASDERAVASCPRPVTDILSCPSSPECTHTHRGAAIPQLV